MQVCIMGLDGDKKMYEVVLTDTVKILRAKIEAKEGIPPEMYMLIRQGRILDDDALLDDRIVWGDEHILWSETSPNGPTFHRIFRIISSKSKQIFVVGKLSKEENTYKTYEVKLTDTIESIKAKIQNKQGIPPEHFCLIYEGKQLDDGGRTLEDYKVKGRKIELVMN